MKTYTLVYQEMSDGPVKIRIGLTGEDIEDITSELDNEDFAVLTDADIIKPFGKDFISAFVTLPSSTIKL